MIWGRGGKIWRSFLLAIVSNFSKAHLKMGKEKVLLNLLVPLRLSRLSTLRNLFQLKITRHQFDSKMLRLFCVISPLPQTLLLQAHVFSMDRVCDGCAVQLLRKMGHSQVSFIVGLTSKSYKVPTTDLWSAIKIKPFWVHQEVEELKNFFLQNIRK